MQKIFFSQDYQKWKILGLKYRFLTAYFKSNQTKNNFLKNIKKIFEKHPKMSDLGQKYQFLNKKKFQSVILSFKVTFTTVKGYYFFI